MGSQCLIIFPVRFSCIKSLVGLLRQNMLLKSQKASASGTHAHGASWLTSLGLATREIPARQEGIDDQGDREKSSPNEDIFIQRLQCHAFLSSGFACVCLVGRCSIVISISPGGWGVVRISSTTVTCATSITLTSSSAITLPASSISRTLTVTRSSAPVTPT